MVPVRQPFTTCPHDRSRLCLVSMATNRGSIEYEDRSWRGASETANCLRMRRRKAKQRERVPRRSQSGLEHYRVWGLLSERPDAPESRVSEDVRREELQ